MRVRICVRRPERTTMSEIQLIRLQQYLKVVGLAATGGEAKNMIQEGLVYVNGEVETRRKKQLAPGDVVTVDGESFVVEYEDDGS
jgi:ribosome-associated protein